MEKRISGNVIKKKTVLEDSVTPTVVCKRQLTRDHLFCSRANVLKVDIFFEYLNYEVISEELSYEASSTFCL